MEEIVRTEKVVRRFGGLVAVNGVDFSLERGEVRGLIGPNGSGKTTLINLISGVYEPNSGEIVFNGERITGKSPNQIAVKGMLRTFQVPRLFGNMTLLENMLLPRFADFHLGYRREYPAAVRQAQGLLQAAGLAHLQDSSAKILSGGQKALLQLMRGFMLDGLTVYLLDEPFAGVNMVIKETMHEMIDQKAAEGVSFVLVSHEMASIRRMCKLVTVLAQGTIIAHGSMDEVASNTQVINAYLGGTA